MAEYIKKSSLIDHIEKELREWGEEYDVEQILGDIEDFPAADVVERKSGKWVLKTFNDGYGEYQLYECNQCGAQTVQRRKYCYDCGARMESES